MPKPESTSVPQARPTRWLIVSGAVLLTFGTIWLAWSQMARRRLQARVDAIVARREPFYPQDFATAPVPKAENAATYFQAATAAMSATVWSPSNSQLEYKEYPPFPAEWQQMTEQAVAVNGRTLALARQARPFDRVDWGTTQYSLPSNSTRALACLLGDVALLDHVHGDDAEAVERIRDIRHEAQVLDNWPGGLVGHLVAAGIESFGIDRLEVMAPDLGIASDKAVASPTTNPAALVDRTTLRDMVKDLLDDRLPRERRMLAALSARSGDYSYVGSIRARASILRPILDLEAARVLDNGTCLLRAIEEPTFASAEQIMSHRPLKAPKGFWIDKNPNPPRYSHMVSAEFASSDNYIRVEWQVIAERRVAATDLAIQMYRADHNAWPATLGELVPRYLSAVPSDPFSTSNQPLGYRVLRGALPGAADRPLLYFAAPAGGLPGPPPTEPSFGISGHGTQWCDLSRWSPPETGAVTQP